MIKYVKSNEMIEVGCGDQSKLLLRQCIWTWEDQMNHIVKAMARGSWGKDWFGRLMGCLSTLMQKGLNESSHLDLYRISNISLSSPDIFFPASLINDEAKELHRNRMCHLQFLRVKLSHFEKPLAPTECLAGVLAARDMLRAHGAEAQSIDKMQSIFDELRRIIDHPRDIIDHPRDITLRLDIDLVFPLLADVLLVLFFEVVGGQVRLHHRVEGGDPTTNSKRKGGLPKQHDLHGFGENTRTFAPRDLRDLCNVLDPSRKGSRNQRMSKDWCAYWACDFDLLAGDLKQIQSIKNKLNHEDNAMGAESVQLLLDSALRVFEALDIRSTRLDDLRTNFAADVLGYTGEDNQVGVRVKVGTRKVSLEVVGLDKVLVGRDDVTAGAVKELREAAARGGACRIVLTGPSGVGKTTVARRVCEVVRNEIPLQLFVQGSSAAALRHELARVGQILIPELSADAKVEDAVKETLLRLRQMAGWVLVVDDADPEVLDELLPTGAAGQPVGLVLMTSQRPHETWPSAASRTLGFGLQMLSTEQSIELLGREEAETRDRPVDKNVLKDNDCGVARFVNDYLGNLPLAVAMLRATLRGKKLEEARGIMRSLRARGMERRLGVGQGDWYVRTLPGMVEALLERMRERCKGNAGLHRASMRILAMMCSLDGRGVPHELFVTPLEGRQMKPLIEQGLFLSAISALAQVGLLDNRQSVGMVGMHSLYQRCVVEHLTGGQMVSLVEWADLSTAMQELFVDGVEDHESRSLVGKLYMSALLWWKKIGNPISLLRMTEAIGIASWRIMLDWDTAEKSLTRCMRAAEGILECCQRKSAEVCEGAEGMVERSARNLALLYEEMGQLDKAAALAERSLRICERLFGPEHQHTMRSLCILVKLYQAMGRLEDAVPLAERALCVCERVFGDEHPNTSTSLDNLASLYRVTGRLEEAVPLAERAVWILERVPGADHPGTPKSIGNLSLLYLAMGRYEKALPLAKRALGISELQLGADHPHTAVLVGNLGALFLEMGRFEEALPLAERDVGVSERVLGAEHPDTARSINNLALIYQAVAQFDKALPLFKRAFGIRERVLGGEHPETLKSMNNLATIYYEMGTLEEALPLAERDAGISERVLGAEHPDTAMKMSNLAMIYRALGRLEEAVPRSERAARICERVLGPEHPDTAMRLGCLALLYQDIGRFEEALQLSKRCVGTCERVHGAEHPGTLTSINNLTLLLMAMGRTEEAVPLAERGLGICERASGADHPGTAIHLGNLSSLYHSLGRLKEAVPLAERGLGICDRVLGSEHPETAKMVSNLALLYEDMGRLEKAVVLRKRAFVTCNEKLGADHPLTADRAFKLARLYKATGRSKDAIVFCRRALDVRERVLGVEHRDTQESAGMLLNLFVTVGGHDDEISVLTARYRAALLCFLVGRDGVGGMARP